MLLLNYTRIRECPEQENLGLPARSPAFGLAMTSGWQQEAVAAPSQWNSRVATKLGTWHICRKGCSFHICMVGHQWPCARWPSDYVFWQRSSWKGCCNLGGSPAAIEPRASPGQPNHGSSDAMSPALEPAIIFPYKLPSTFWCVIRFSAGAGSQVSGLLLSGLALRYGFVVACRTSLHLAG